MVQLNTTELNTGGPLSSSAALAGRIVVLPPASAPAITLRHAPPGLLTMPLTNTASAPPRRRIAALVAVEVWTKVKFARL
ncbi:hypothetical protein [Sphingomonas aurantiaca]|uniref:hypothetical protein n=1 Tax=Sphingomonas aurantiaca TaxID=185949 RepID=UPI002FE228D4